VEAKWSPNGDVLALIERYSVGRFTDGSEYGAFGRRIVIPGFEVIEEIDLKLLDAQTGERRVKVEDAARSLPGYHALIYARLEHPTFSPDGKILAAMLGTEVTLWNVSTGKKVLTLKKVKGDPAAIAFSPDNRTVAVASIRGKMPGGESEITVWEVPSGKEVHRLKGKNDEISTLQFAPDGRALLIGSLQYEREGSTGTVKMWNLHENRLGRLNVRNGKPVSSLVLLADQSVVVQSDEDVELWDAKTWEVKYSFEPSEEDEDEANRRSRFLMSAKRAVAVAFSRDGLTISAEIPGEGVRHWDSRTGGLRDQTGGVKDGAVSDDTADAAVAMSANGDFRAEATGSGVRVTNVGKGTEEEFKFSGDGPIAALALSPDGKLIVVATGDQIAVLKTADKAPAVTFDVGQEITAVAIDPSGQLVAVARADRSIVFWSLKTGSMQGELRKHQNVINALAFSPDGRMLASGGDDRTAILWEVASGKAKRTLKGHDVTVTSLAFSPDGRLLASGSGNAAVVLWNVASGKLDRILR
jgi:WD40 repeat protein